MSGRRARRGIAWRIGAAAVVVGTAACTAPLPDADSPAARVYEAECGVCHRAYPPSLLTAAMWEVQVARMDEMRRRRGLPPLGDTQRAVILSYLRAHAG